MLLQIKVAGFSEDDQANLFTLAHNGKTAGKQGLGISSRPKKVGSPLTDLLHHPDCMTGPSSSCQHTVDACFVQMRCIEGFFEGEICGDPAWQVAGARWAGTKTRLGDDDGEGEEAEEPGTAAAGQAAEAAAAGSDEDCSEDTHVSSGSADEQEPEVQQQQQKRPARVGGQATGGKRLRSGAAEEGGSSGVDARLLRRLALSVLKAAGGRLRVKKLEKRVLDAAGVPRGGARRREARQSLSSALHKEAAKFAVDAEHVALVS